ncbi:hypothetical protein CP532_5871 [Ophiocordyceps camponoti-leonardi (nom. inval.)]|nr:hypothetical protein CP532_5871 [Ophiocordyceps camponoti-leonardi (nom. inval.)]
MSPPINNHHQPASGKTCLITGGAGGLGKAIASQFLKGGANVIICDINAERLEKASTELAAVLSDGGGKGEGGGASGRFKAVTADITSADAVQRLYHQIVGDFRTLDILVNNAAVMDRFEPVADLEMDLWDRVLAVNLTAPMLLSKLAVRLMLEKADPSAFYRDKGIRCNALAMGLMLGTNIDDAFRDDCHQEGQQMVMDVLSGTKPRSCDVEDVASFLHLLPSSSSSSSTMNVVHPSQAPPEYQRVAWMADTCKLLMGIGWTANYIGMIYKSLRDDTYAMSLMALCCNFAWEVTYAIIYPFGSHLEKTVHYTGLLLNCGVMYTAVKNAPAEWTHAPLVRRHVRLIFVVCVAGWTSAHVALAAQVGPSLAQAWIALSRAFEGVVVSAVILEERS